MFELVESIRQQWLREMGWPPLDTPRTATYFYRSHKPELGCGCSRYFELLDACPVRIPQPQEGSQK